MINSCSFLNIQLSKLPEALGIKDLAKGYHPYCFTDLNYVVQIVLQDYFDLLEEEKALEEFKWCYEEK